VIDQKIAIQHFVLLGYDKEIEILWG
jgi:hypothetical protein